VTAATAAAAPAAPAAPAAAAGVQQEAPSVLQQLYQGAAGTAWLSGGPQVGVSVACDAFYIPCVMSISVCDAKTL
jgi:hypothetical protein